MTHSRSTSLRSRRFKATAAVSAAAGISLGFVGGVALTRHNGEAEPRPEQPIPTSVSADTASDAIASLEKGDTFNAYVLKGRVSPPGGVQGEDTVYNPLEFAGDSRLWYAVCRGSGKVALTQIPGNGDTRYYPYGSSDVDPIYDRSDIDKEVETITAVQSICGLGAVREGYATPYTPVAYANTPKGD